MRAILFGIGAAVAGCVLYAAVEIGTGWTIGYVALAVGYMVGKAMKLGSRGNGGRRYQIAAAILTYVAVAMAAVPVALHQQSQQSSKDKSAKSAGISGTQEGASGQGSVDRNSDTPAPARDASGHGTGYFVMLLVGIGMASPFMDLSGGISGFIGLFILFIGIRAAWQLTAGTEFPAARTSPV